MKGPYGRLRYRVQRVWQCPVCQRRERTPGSVVARRCTCQAKSDPSRMVWMQLIEEPTRRPNRYEQRVHGGNEGASSDTAAEAANGGQQN